MGVNTERANRNVRATGDGGQVALAIAAFL